MPPGRIQRRWDSLWANLASRQNLDKRARNDEINENKKRKIEQGEEINTPIYATNFSQEEIENEQRRPKKKAAVLIGYSGTGYHGMQLYAFLSSNFSVYTKALILFCFPEPISSGQLKETSSQPSSLPVRFRKPTPQTPRNPHLCDVLGQTRVSMPPAILFL